MDEQRDIYQESEPPAPPEPAPLPEPTPAQVRAKTLRNTVVFSAIMLVLLGASTWFISVQEKKSKRPELTPEVVDTTTLTPRPAAPAGPVPAAAPLAAAPIVAPAPAEPAPAIDPEKMAQAMGETRIANEYLIAHDLDRAEVHARKALEIAPDLNAALRLVGVVYTQRGQFDQAVEILERSLAADPYNPETYNNLATAYMQKGMMDKAEELLQTSLQIVPGYTVAFLNLGLMNLLRGRYDAAADYFERAIERLPNDPSARVNLAVCLMRLGRYEDARGHLQTALNVAPDLPGTYFNMAISYVLDGNFDEAMAWIRRGAEHCSPVQCQKYLADADFNALRNHPPFQAFLNSLYPDLPPPPKT